MPNWSDVTNEGWAQLVVPVGAGGWVAAPLPVPAPGLPDACPLPWALVPWPAGFAAPDRLGVFGMAAAWGVATTCGMPAAAPSRVPLAVAREALAPAAVRAPPPPM